MFEGRPPAPRVTAAETEPERNVVKEVSKQVAAVMTAKGHIAAVATDRITLDSR